MTVSVEPWVIKFGGSLAKTETLTTWLGFLRRCSSDNVSIMIVPGGGIFADAIRESQKIWDFSDKAGHQMAVCAMEQYAHMLADLAGGLPVASTLMECRTSLATNPVTVWLPSVMVNHENDLPTDWNLTSDSLAVWLANQLQVEQIALIKSVGPSAIEHRAIELASKGIVDMELSGMLQQCNAECWWVGDQQAAQLHTAIISTSTEDLSQII